MAGSFVGTTIAIDERMYTEPQIPARWIGSRSASFQTWLTSSCLQLNPTGWCIPSALAAKPRQFHSRKMPVIPHQCSLYGRVTRKQWEQHWPPLPAMLQADVLRKPGFYVLYLLKCGLSPMPTYQLGSIWCTVRKRWCFSWLQRMKILSHHAFYFLVIRPATKTFLSIWSTRVFIWSGFRHAFPIYPSLHSEMAVQHREKVERVPSHSTQLTETGRKTK